jgi:hypothetical protein
MSDQPDTPRPLREWNADPAMLESLGRAVTPTSLYEYQQTKRLGHPLPQLPKDPGAADV